MNQLFEEFKKPGYIDWVNQLKKDLKGESETLIQRNDIIEEIQFNSYQHEDSGNTSPAFALNNPYVRQTYRATNAWENVGTICVINETEANKKALQLLNLGATALRFELCSNTLNWENLVQDIQLEFIETTFKINQPEHYILIQNKLTADQKKKVYFELDLIENKNINTTDLINHIKSNQTYTFIANGYSVQQAGATTWQEIAYSLSAAHETLIQLTENGLTIDEAAACIHFNVGVGATYFYEIAKIRAVRILWARILEEYQPEHACSYNTRITGIVGFTNKSLKDPYTNLLRQTTEAMSLIFAGVNSICVQAYDAHSTKGSTTLSLRMAVNIPLILQEESYLDKVIDPLAGSYGIEYLTNEIADKAWKLFQEIENKGGITTPDTLAIFKKAIEEKATLRRQRIQEKTDTLIGINIFPNPTAEDNNWKEFDGYLGLPQLILEQSI